MIEDSPYHRAADRAHAERASLCDGRVITVTVFRRGCQGCLVTVEAASCRLRAVQQLTEDLAILWRFFIAERFSDSDGLVSDGLFSLSASRFHLIADCFSQHRLETGAVLREQLVQRFAELWFRSS